MGLRGPNATKFVVDRLRSLAADICPKKLPIPITAEMVRLIIRQHERQEIFTGCLRGRCKAKDDRHKCRKCIEYDDAADRLRELSGMREWTVSGLPDREEPPCAIVLNARACNDWRRAWRLKQDLIAAAKKKLGE